MFKFIHAADIHLDSPLRGLDKYEGAPVQAIRGATRRAFSNLVSLSISEHVDFVILAGDIYDGEWPDYNTGLFFVNELRKLDKANIQVVLLSGNHDAESRIASRLTLPPNTHVLPTDKPDTVTFDSLHVKVHGQGYANQAETRNLAVDYPPPKSGYFHIGVLHTALDGRDGHDPYAPCTLEELIASGYDYWALGHVHQRESVNLNGHPWVEFPGNLQGRKITETGAKGCLLVTVDSTGRAKPEFHAVDVFRWENITVEATEAVSKSETLGAVVKALEDARDQAEGRPLAARIMLSCREPVYLQLVENMAQFRFDLAGQAGTNLWVEKIKLANVGAKQESEPPLTGDADSELRTVLAELRSDPKATQELFGIDDCLKLKRVLPTELKNLFDDHREDIFDLAATLLRDNANAEERS
jgi:exonuclease SbcD